MKKFLSVILIVGIGNFFSWNTALSQISPGERTFSYNLSDASPMSQGTGFFEFGLDFQDFEFSNSIDYDLAAEYAMSDRISVGITTGYRTLNPDSDFADNQNGGKDAMVTAWGSVFSNENVNVVVGGGFDIPWGSEEVDEGNFDYMFHGTGRFHIGDNIIGIGQVNCESYEPFFDDQDRESSWGVRGSLLYQVSDKYMTFGEINVREDTDIFRLTSYSYGIAGLRASFASNFDIGAGIGTGFSEDSSDFIGKIRVGWDLSF